MKKIRHRFEFEIPIYEWDVKVIRMQLGHSSHRLPHELVDELENDFIDELMDDINSGGTFGHYFTYPFRRRAILIVCARDYDGPEYVNILAHETNHMIDRILGHASVDDTEARSYLTGFIYEQYRREGLI